MSCERKEPNHGYTYSEIYSDERYDYIHVLIPRAKAKKLFPNPMRLLTKGECFDVLALNIELPQPGEWTHYLLSPRDKYLLLFRRTRVDHEVNVPSSANTA